MIAHLIRRPCRVANKRRRKIFVPTVTTTATAAAATVVVVVVVDVDIVRRRRFKGRRGWRLRGRYAGGTALAPAVCSGIDLEHETGSWTGTSRRSFIPLFQA